MIEDIALAALAFLVASVVAWLELVTSKYPRTFGLLLSSKKLLAYAAIYGAIAALVTIGLEQLTESGAIRLEGAIIRNRWIQAIAIGVAVKALLHIRLFTVTTGSQSVPVGIETITLIFEPWLLESIHLDEFCALREFVVPRARLYPDLADAKDRILRNLPNHLQPGPIKVDLDKATTVTEVMETYFRLCGKTVFNIAFPPH